MKEGLSRIFDQLREKNIAIHGTNGARSAAIETKGFSQSQRLDYCQFKPPELDVRSALTEIVSEIALATQHAFKASDIVTNPQYALSGNAEVNATPTLVLFWGPENGSATETAYCLWPGDGHVEGNEVIGLIPVDNVRLPRDVRYTELGTTYYSKMVSIGIRIYRLLLEKGVVESPWEKVKREAL